MKRPGTMKEPRDVPFQVRKSWKEWLLEIVLTMIFIGIVRGIFRLFSR